MKSIPETLKPFSKTDIFNEDTIPAGFLKEHIIIKGVWGEIHMLAGNLEYNIVEGIKETVILTPDKHGVVEPQVKHYIKPLSSVSFYVEFYKVAA